MTETPTVRQSFDCAAFNDGTPAARAEQIHSKAAEMIDRWSAYFTDNREAWIAEKTALIEHRRFKQGPQLVMEDSQTPAEVVARQWYARRLVVLPERVQAAKNAMLGRSRDGDRPRAHTYRQAMERRQAERRTEERIVSLDRRSGEDRRKDRER
jgi:hypothetical protein